MIKTKHKTIEQYLQISVEQYTEILCHVDTLDSMVAVFDSKELVRHAENLVKMQAEAGKNDKLLLAAIQEDPQAWQENVHFKKRQQLINSILAKNKMVVPKIQTLMAVTKSERAQLEGARTAMNGYQNKRENTTSINRTA